MDSGRRLVRPTPDEPGDGTFADEAPLRLQPHEQSSGNAGVATGAPWAERVEIERIVI